MKAKLTCVLLLVAMIHLLNSCSPVTVSGTEGSTTTVVVLQKVTAYTYTPSELETMALINIYRTSKGLNSLEQNNYISSKCEEHDNYMITNNIVNHNDFVARSEDIMKVLGAKNVGENIAYNYSTPQSAFDAWLSSPEHKANIEGDFTHFGISIRADLAGKKYYNNIFAKI